MVAFSGANSYSGSPNGECCMGEGEGSQPGKFLRFSFFHLLLSFPLLLLVNFDPQLPLPQRFHLLLLRLFPHGHCQGCQDTWREDGCLVVLAILLQYFYKTFTILISQNISKYTINIVGNADIVGNVDIVVGNVDIVVGNVDIIVGNVDIVHTVDIVDC